MLKREKEQKKEITPSSKILFGRGLKNRKLGNRDVSRCFPTFLPTIPQVSFPRELSRKTDAFDDRRRTIRKKRKKGSEKEKKNRGEKRGRSTNGFSEERGGVDASAGNSSLMRARIVAEQTARKWLLLEQ